jgi:hypothetical protein
VVNLNLKVSDSAKNFFQQQGVADVTFNLVESEVSGCCIGFVREIEPVYRAPENASGYRYCKAEGFHVFIAREIKLSERLTLTTEGVWRKKLCLTGATIPI